MQKLVKCISPGSNYRCGSESSYQQVPPGDLVAQYTRCGRLRHRRRGQRKWRRAGLVGRRIVAIIAGRTGRRVRQVGARVWWIVRYWTRCLRYPLRCLRNVGLLDSRDVREYNFLQRRPGLFLPALAPGSQYRCIRVDRCRAIRLPTLRDRLDEGGTRWGTAIWPFYYSLENSLFNRFWQGWIALPWWRRLVFHLFQEGIIRCFALEWYVPGKELVGYYPQAVAVAGKLRFALCLLWRHVFGSAGPGTRATLKRWAREQLGQAEVGQEQPVLLQQHIGRLDIAVQHILAMCVINSLGSLA